MGSLDKYIDNLDSLTLKGYQEKRVKKVSQELKSIINTYNKIVFMCTHNSRRSQLCEAWGSILSKRFNLDLFFYSAGTEKTEVYPEVIKSLQRAGLEIDKGGKINDMHYQIELYSKTLDEVQEDEFIALMTCSEAEKNCPVDPRSKKNIKLFYNDPKKFDGTHEESSGYDESCKLIASELNAIFKSLVDPI